MIPRSTYRVQLRQGIDFAAVAAALPYFARLGVSHLYLSPIMRAAPGSTHGYDATSFEEIDPELGGATGFDALADAARAAGLRLILDFVPNHMSASMGNRWWRDVLERGARSTYAQHFDIDWTAPKLLVPILGEPYGGALDEGRLRVGYDAGHVSFVMRYGDARLPLAPSSYSRILARMAHPAGAELALQFAADDVAGTALPALEARASDPDFRDAADAAAAAISDDREALHELLEAQVWRVAHWRLGRDGLTYRRFFEIVDLIGVAVERPPVFAAVHGLVAGLARSGKVDGLRIDHIDGLADPKLYLDRLRETIDAPSAGTYLVVEKILGEGEALRPWPVAGTTGYEFLSAVSGVQVDPRGEEGMSEAYAACVGAVRPFDELCRSTKRFILTRNLAGELDRLRDLALVVASADRATRDFGGDSLRRALVELAAAMPVYRTYVTVEGASDADRQVVARAIAAASATRQVEDEAVLAFLGRLLLLDFGTPELQAAALAFATRFQQTSGPVMAKAVEDTAFYRWNRLIALNEVGGDPSRFGGTVEAFHDAMAERLRQQPAGLTPLATHDTKRGADARARLHALSEAPDLWRAAVFRLRETLPGGAEPDTEWLFLQSLLGALPADFDPADDAAAERLAERMKGYVLKALREAKELTSWAAPDVEHEEKAIAGTVAVLADPAFRAAFAERAEPFVLAGALNSLAQLALQLTVPGIPDIYQGGEGWDLSLVDPDNRQPVDFTVLADRLAAVRDAGIADLLARWRSGLVKTRLLHAGLQLRQRLPEVFASGSYEPLTATGREASRVLAFARRSGGRSVVTIVPRLALGLLAGSGTPLVLPDRWGDTRIDLTAFGELRDVVTGATWSGHCTMAELLGAFPVAILERA